MQINMEERENKKKKKTNQSQTGWNYNAHIV